MCIFICQMLFRKPIGPAYEGMSVDDFCAVPVARKAGLGQPGVRNEITPRGFILYLDFSANTDSPLIEITVFVDFCWFNLWVFVLVFFLPFLCYFIIFVKGSVLLITAVFLCCVFKPPNQYFLIFASTEFCIFVHNNFSVKVRIYAFYCRRNNRSFPIYI